MHIQRLQNPHDFHMATIVLRRCRSRGFRRSGYRDGAAMQQYLVFQFRVGAEDLAMVLEAVLVVAGELRLDIEASMVTGTYCLRQPVENSAQLSIWATMTGDLGCAIARVLACAQRDRAVVVEDECLCRRHSHCRGPGGLPPAPSHRSGTAESCRPAPSAAS